MLCWNIPFKIDKISTSYHVKKATKCSLQSHFKACFLLYIVSQLGPAAYGSCTDLTQFADVNPPQIEIVVTEIGDDLWVKQMSIVPCFQFGTAINQINQ